MTSLKKFIILMNILLLFTVGLAAQVTATGISGETPNLVVDFATFTGIVSVVSLLVTQVAKLIPSIETTKWLKPIVSVVIGILSCFFGWVLQLSPFLSGLAWYMILIYGVFAGLSACGLYSILKPIIELIFKPKTE